MSAKPKFIIDCADHAGFVRMVEGKKTILTRANKSPNPLENYCQANPGDILELVDNNTGDKILVEILSANNFKSVSELFEQSKIASESFNKDFVSEKELRAEYEGNRPGYTKLIDANGLVAWRIKLIEG